MLPSRTDGDNRRHGITDHGVAYTIRGEGPPLLLLSGYASTAGILQPAARLFAQRFTTITFDYPGAGRSTGVRLPVTTSMLAREAAGLLGSLGITRAHVYGISLGGLIAQELAIRHPEMIRTLILGATTAGGWRSVPGDPTALMATLWSLRTLPGGGRIPLPHTALLQGWAAGTHDTSSRLATITAPTLVIHGEHDRLMPLRNGQLLADGIPGAELRILRGQGHLYLFEDDASSYAVMDWIEGSREPDATPARSGDGTTPLLRAMMNQALPARHFATTWLRAFTP